MLNEKSMEEYLVQLVSDVSYIKGKLDHLDEIESSLEDVRKNLSEVQVQQPEQTRRIKANEARIKNLEDCIDKYRNYFIVLLIGWVVTLAKLWII